MTTRVDLATGWTLHAARPDGIPADVLAALPVPATVPGTVHTDLLAAGLIPDPYLDRNEDVVAWIGRADWEYRLDVAFELLEGEEGEEVELEFDGLDTVATVVLNGVVVAETENMHRRYRMPVTTLLRPGANELAVRFASALAFAEAEAEREGDLPRQYPMPYNFIRKSACNFGWDWGPALVGAGIWRPARLVRHTGPRIAEVRPRATVDGTRGVVAFEVLLSGTVAERGTVRATVDGVAVQADLEPGATSVALEVTVDDVALWWPRGLGAQPLSEAGVEVRDADGRVLDAWTHRVGFRTVTLDTTPDDDGSRFALVVNGVTVPVRGANWIPDDCFFPRVTPGRLRRRIGQAVDADLNLLRIWGGGTYESDDFYRICDEEGMLVWQDFLFACAAYPEYARIAAEVEAEARDNVARLLPHPSLVLWNGSNENIWGEQDWDWRPGIAGRDWGLGYYLDLLPRVVAEVDPTRPYWASSPYSGTLDIHPNDDEHGTKHVWDVWNEVDYTVYRDYRPRFAAEFGWQAPPAWSTMTRALHDDPLTPDSPGMRHHQKAKDGVGKLGRGIARHLPEPAGLDDWHYAAQLTQARAVRVGIEWFRSLRPWCSGTILWQLNDCWPVTSWSVVDGDERRKASWYALRAASRPRLLTLQPHQGGGLELVAVNDDPAPWSGDLVLRRQTLRGVVHYEQRMPLLVDGLGVERVPLPPLLAEPGVAGEEVLVADIPDEPGARAAWFFADDRDLAYPADPVTATAERDGEDVVLTLVGTGYARDVTLFPDRLAPAAESDDSGFDLLPGETRRVRVTGVPAGREDELTRAPVLRHVGQLIGGA